MEIQGTYILIVAPIVLPTIWLSTGNPLTAQPYISSEGSEMNSTLRVAGVAVLVLAFLVAGAAGGEDVFPILRGPYLGQEPPGMTPEVFAPGIISRDEYEMNSVFSPDGSEFFYVISTSTPEEKKQGHYYYVIMTSRIVDRVWSAPARLKVIGESSATDIALAPDGRLYFCSDAQSPWNEPTALDLWYVERSAEGWSDPVNVGPGINTAKSETQPTFTTQGKMYYPSVREDTRGGVDIYHATRNEDGYSNPVNVGAPVNTEFNEGNSFVAPDESYLLFARWGMPESIDGGKALYISFRKDDGGWTEPINTGPSAGLRGSLAALSPDGRYLFFSSGGDIYWVDSSVIDVLRDQAFAKAASATR